MLLNLTERNTILKAVKLEYCGKIPKYQQYMICASALFTATAALLNNYNIASAFAVLTVLIMLFVNKSNNRQVSEANLADKPLSLDSLKYLEANLKPQILNLLHEAVEKTEDSVLRVHHLYDILSQDDKERETQANMQLASQQSQLLRNWNNK